MIIILSYPARFRPLIPTRDEAFVIAYGPAVEAAGYNFPPDLIELRFVEFPDLDMEKLRKDPRTLVVDLLADLRLCFGLEEGCEAALRCRNSGVEPYREVSGLRRTVCRSRPRHLPSWERFPEVR